MLPRIPVGHQLALGTMRDYRERPLCGGHFKTVNDGSWPAAPPKEITSFECGIPGWQRRLDCIHRISQTGGPN